MEESGIDFALQKTYFNLIIRPAETRIARARVRARAAQHQVVQCRRSPSSESMRFPANATNAGYRPAGTRPTDPTVFGEELWMRQAAGRRPKMAVIARDKDRHLYAASKQEWDE